jgi:hypothetical protein
MTTETPAAGAAPAPAPAAGREPVESQPIKATWHINNQQGIQVPESMFPDGKIPGPAPVSEQHLDTYRRFGVGDDVIAQIAARTPVTETEFRLAQHKSAALKGDPAFVRRYLDGGVEERRIMMTLSVILGSQIKKEESNG